MKITEAIAALQSILAEHGDLDMLESGHYTEVSSIRLLEVEGDNDFPKDWNMPKGTKIAMVNYDY